MESGTKDALQLWQGVMSGGNFSYMIRRLSLALLRARVRNLESYRSVRSLETCS